MAIHALGPFRLDTQEGLLLRGSEAVALGRRAIAVLRALIERPGALVSRDALIEAAWSGRAVEESNLAVQIAALRRALGEAPGGERWIETMPGRGYRFVGPVVGSEQTDVIAAPPRIEVPRDAAPIDLGATPAPPRVDASLAVLPFLNLSGDSEQEYFADGMVEEITTALSRISWLFVIARTSSFAYKGQAVDVRRVGQELGARYVLEGSVRKSGDRVRVTAQLIDASSGAHLWADRFEGPLADVFELQDRVASSVAGVIEPVLQAAETARSRRASGEEQGAIAAPSPVNVPPDAVPIEPHEAERRQITAMSCELVGVAAGTGGMDLEDLREAVGAFHRCVLETVDRHDGFTYRQLGNNVLVLFGYPAAHEHDAEQAVRAGLELCAAVRTLEPAAEAPVRCRVGIATGTAIIGDLGGGGALGEREIVGDAPNLAGRLLATTPPDTVAVDPATRRLIGNLFDCRELGAIDTDSGPEPMRSWQVLGESIVASRFEALRGAALSPLIGRDEEIDLLLRRWARAKAGDGQIVLVSGEPGIGKSRLIAALEERLDGEPHLRLRYFCSPYHQDSALFPFIDQLSHAAGFVRDDTPAERLKKLEAVLARAAPPDEDLALLADLLSLPESERHPLPNVSPQHKKERTMEALNQQLEGLARRQPVVVVFEDAHWIDPTSRELLDLSVERVRRLPVLLILTFRPEFQAPWTGQPQVSVLALNRLDRRDRTALVEKIAGGKALPDEVVAQIADRTDGVPLFVEELTKSILESGLLREETDRYELDRALPRFAIPTTLHASLLARLDRLASVRRVAQIGAAIGREFSYPLLRTVSRLPEDELQAALARLVASELVFGRGTPPDAVYSFKHALVQDATYGSLLRSTRQQLHALIAEALETHSPELMENQPELLAQHYTEAGLFEKSATYWSRAGQRSAARSAMAEAATQFQKGLDQLALLPESPKRRRQELETCSSLGAVLIAIKGYAAPETGRVYARAQELWEQLGFPSEFLGTPYGQSTYYAQRGEFDRAQRLAEDLLRLSRDRNDSAGLVLGHFSAGRNLMFVGGLASSRSHLTQALALCHPVSHRSIVHQAGIHPRVGSQAYLGGVLLCLGFPHRALIQSQRAIAEAQRMAHPPSLAVALSVGTLLLSLVGDGTAFGERSDQLVAVAAEHDFPHWRAAGTIFRGWTKVTNGDVAEGISLLRSGSVAYHATGAELWMPRFIAFLAAACEIAGQVEEALTLLDAALQTVERTGERWFAAEVYRQKGRLLHWQGYTEAGEELYRKALSIAVEQEAKLWELRAALSLARLRRDQGRHAEARDLLAPVYGWFTEGFGTPDLIEAKSLLDEFDSLLDPGTTASARL